MDITSIEFYTIAFVVAISLVGFFFARNEKKPASTFIVQLATEPCDESENNDEDQLSLTVLDSGKMLLQRIGLELGAQETANLVITIADDNCEIVEKKGIKRRGAVGLPVKGEVTVKCFKPGKYRMRFDSQISSKWATFTFEVSPGQSKQVALSY